VNGGGFRIKGEGGEAPRCPAQGLAPSQWCGHRGAGCQGAEGGRLGASVAVCSGGGLLLGTERWSEHAALPHLKRYRRACCWQGWLV
jgi:hypothetical protein